MTIVINKTAFGYLDFYEKVSENKWKKTKPRNKSFTVSLLNLFYKNYIHVFKNNCTKEFLNTFTRKIKFDSQLWFSLCPNISVSFVGISDLGCISECASLERLNLSRNDICKLTKLAGLNNLTHLNLSANRIVSLGKDYT